MHGQQLLLLAKLDDPTSREMKVNPACLGIFLPVTDCSRVLDFYLSGLFLLILGLQSFYLDTHLQKVGLDGHASFTLANCHMSWQVPLYGL